MNHTKIRNIIYIKYAVPYWDTSYVTRGARKQLNEIFIILYNSLFPSSRFIYSNIFHLKNKFL